MPLNSEEIIRSIARDFPQTDNGILINNCADLDIEGQVRYGHQYIIGLSQRDPMQAGIDRYRALMEARLGEVRLQCRCLPWSFDDYELDNARQVLAELSEHFNANLNIDRMIGRLNIRRPEGVMYFLVITIVFIPIFFVQQGDSS